MSTATLRLSGIAALLGAAAFGIVGCADVELAPEPHAIADVADDGEPEQVEYLFGLSEAELLDIYPLVSNELTRLEWLATSRAPFRCDTYGDFCDMVGPDAAYTITRASYRLAVGGADIAQIHAQLARDTELAETAWAQRPETVSFRSSEVCTASYSDGEHRVRTKVYKNNPAFAARYGKTNCKLQTDLLVGWGGNERADELTAFVEIVESPAEWAENEDTNVHSLTTEKIYPGKNQTVRGRCTGTYDGEVETRTCSVD